MNFSGEYFGGWDFRAGAEVGGTHWLFKAPPTLSWLVNHFLLIAPGMSQALCGIAVEFFFLQPCLFIALRVHNIAHAASPSQLLPFLTPGPVSQLSPVRSTSSLRSLLLT